MGKLLKVFKLWFMYKEMQQVKGCFNLYVPSWFHNFDRRWCRYLWQAAPVWPDEGIKICQIFKKSCHIKLYSNSDTSQMAQKVSIYLSYYCRKNCQQDHSKIAQSGHSGQHLDFWIGIVMVRIRNFLKISFVVDLKTF